jgi:hypothetical protein
MRKSSQTTVVRIHEGMNRGNVDGRDYVDSLLSRVRIHQSRLMRSFALICAQLGIAPRSLALAPIQGRPAMCQAKNWSTPESLG